MRIHLGLHFRLHFDWWRNCRLRHFLRQLRLNRDLNDRLEDRLALRRLRDRHQRVRFSLVDIHQPIRACK